MPTKVYRRKNGKNFYYVNNRNNRINNAKTLEYIKSLRIPPAYKNVEIDLNKNAKAVAFGFDNKDRKQVIYSKKWISKSQKKKYCSLINFGKILPQLSRDIDRNLNRKK